jgi:DNA-binding transcriptional regulator PaaX
VINRAERHDQVEGVQRSHIAEHLGFAHRAATTLGLRSQLERLTEEGALRLSRRYGSGVFGLTRTGRARLTRARRAKETLELPEAPQHRKWREAHAQAARQLDNVREEIDGSLAEAQSLLADPDGRADAWVELSARLQRECLRIATAVYCANERAEPDDAHGDIDDAHRQLRKLSCPGTSH